MIEHHGWKAFPAVAMGTTLLSGVQTLVSGGVGLGSLAPNIVCFGLLSRHGRGEGNNGSKGGGHVRAGAVGSRSDWLGGPDEYLTALQTCVFFGKSLLIAHGFDQATAAAALLDDAISTAGAGTTVSGRARTGGGSRHTHATRQVDVWIFPSDGAGTWDDSRLRGAVDSGMLDVSDEECDDLDESGGRRPTQNWSSDSTVSMSLQLA